MKLAQFVAPRGCRPIHDHTRLYSGCSISLYITKGVTVDCAQLPRTCAALGSEMIVRKWLRRIRGAIGMGFIWAAAWSAAGLVPRWVFGFNADAPFPLIFGVLGFVAGITFSVVLVLSDGRRRFDQISLPRFAGWGAMGGLLLSALFAKAASLGWEDVRVIAPTFALACAACASGSLALARRAGRQELPDGRADTAKAELLDPAKPKRLRGND